MTDPPRYWFAIRWHDYKLDPGITSGLSTLKRPTFIVGQCPGLQIFPEADYTVWRGNRSGRFMETITKDKKNIVFTNVVNKYFKTQPSKKDYIRGIKELQQLIKLLRPKKILCFGVYAFHNVKKLELPVDVVIKFFEHPSYVLRFKHYDVIKYVEEVRNEL